MANYRRKPVDVEAFKLGRDNFPDWFQMAVHDGRISVFTQQGCECRKIYCTIRTLVGITRGECGDYIIQEPNGTMHSCKADVFEATHEPIKKARSAEV